jgi:hypothetical protein
MFRSIAAAIDKGAVSGRFIFISDDHFYTKPVDFAQHPVFYRAKTLPRPGTEKPTQYWRDLAYTYEVLESKGLSVRDFSGHVGGVFDTADLDAARRLFDEQPLDRQVIEPYCAFIATRMARAPEPTVFRKDLKITTCENMDVFQKTVHDNLCFSTGDGLWKDPHYQKFMNDMYGSSLCKYEHFLATSLRVGYAPDKAVCTYKKR